MILWSLIELVSLSEYLSNVMPCPSDLYILFYLWLWTETASEGGHCQDRDVACHPQWFFYFPKWDRANINSSQMLKARF